MKETSPRRLLEAASQRLDLPSDLAAGLSRVELLGFGTLTVEQHRGIVHFAGQQLALRVPDGLLVISGRDLTIRRMTAEEIVVDGRFTSLAFQEAEA